MQFVDTGGGILGYVEFDHMLLIDMTAGQAALASTLENNDALNSMAPYGRSFIFNGLDSHLLGTENYFNEYNQTIMVRMKIEDISTNQFLVASFGSSAQRFRINSNEIQFRCSCTGTNILVEYALDASDIGEWKTVAITRSFDGTNTEIKLYVDGVLEDTNSVVDTPLLPSGNLIIGGRTASTRMFDGEFSNNVLIYNEVKDSTFILNYHNAIIAAANNESDALAYSSLTELDGGHYTGLLGIPLDTSIDDDTFRTYCYAKVYSTYSLPTIQGIYTFIKNTFGIESHVYSTTPGEITVFLYEHLTSIERIILRVYAPRSAGMSLSIINWPDAP